MYTGHLFHDVEMYIICLSEIKYQNVEVVFVRNKGRNNYAPKNSEGMPESGKVCTWLFKKLFNEIKYVETPKECDKLISRKNLKMNSDKVKGINKAFANNIFNFPIDLWQKKLNLPNLINTGNNPLKILYSCRQNTNSRRLDDESHKKLCLIIKKYGGTIVESFDKISLENQIKIFNNHNCLIGVHGNNLTGLMWMPSRSHIFEILPYQHRNYAYDYWALSNIMKNNYQQIDAHTKHTKVNGLMILDSNKLHYIDSNFHYLNTIFGN